MSWSNISVPNRLPIAEQIANDAHWFFFVRGSEAVAADEEAIAVEAVEDVEDMVVPVRIKRVPV